MIRKGKDYTYIYDRQNKKSYKLNSSAFTILSHFIKYHDLNEFYNYINSKIKNKNMLEKVSSIINYGIKNNLFVNRKLDYEAIVINESLDLKTIQIELTNECNLHCLHCYMGDSKYDYLSLDDVKEIIDFSSSKGVENICFTGGEPLLNKFFFDIVKYTYLSGMKILICTNGTTIDDNFIKFCKKYPIELVRISIDGNENNHDYIRNQKGVFIKSLNSIKLLKENDVNVEVSYTLNNINKNDISDVMSIFRDIGVKINIDIFTCEGNGLENKNILYLNNEESARIMYDNNAVNRSFKSNFKWCGICDSFIYISSTGEIKICSTIDIANQDIYNFKIQNKFVGWDTTINHFRELHTSYKCKNYDFCELSGLCGGGCRSRSNLYGGTTDSPDKFMCTLCSMVKQSKTEVSLI